MIIGLCLTYIAILCIFAFCIMVKMIKTEIESREWFSAFVSAFLGIGFIFAFCALAYSAYNAFTNP